MPRFKRPFKPVQQRAISADICPVTSTYAGILIYTDGACEPNPGPGGWGFAVYRGGKEVHFDHGGSGSTTNNIQEMTAALMALQWFSAREFVEPVRVFSDSQYVVNGCNDWRHKWKLAGWKRGQKPLANAQLWQELDAALSLVPIKLEWTRGHTGNIGNERADELACLGMGELPDAELTAIERQLHYTIN